MDVWIQYNKEKKGTLSYLSLPIYRLLCEQVGFQTRWDQKERILHLTSGLQGKKIYLASTKGDETQPSILTHIKTFFSGTGVELIPLNSDLSSPEDGEIFLQIKWDTNRSVHLPQFHIRYSRDDRGKSWAKAFQRELKMNGFTSRVQADSKQHSVPMLELRCQLPEGKENEQEFQENITLIFASALFRGLTQGNLSTLLPHLSLETLRLIFPMEPNNQNSLPASTFNAAVQETNSSADAAKLNKTGMIAVKPDAFKPERKGEVYFDHQVLVPNSEDDPYLILGNMYIKNTGSEDLVNPLICLKTTPTDGIQLKGQIVPPKMVDTVGVQSFDGNGAVGWKYLEEDWFKKAKDRGEYWISPIQDLRISPGAIDAFSNFQLSIPKFESGRTVTVQGMVFFKDHNLQLPSNNRIIISF